LAGSAAWRAGRLDLHQRDGVIGPGTGIAALVVSVLALIVVMPGLRERIILDPDGRLMVFQPTVIPRMNLASLAQVREAV
jgi:hypothetical protein